MFVAGTAGHVDHGKSTLIHALTGIDPDRLAQEKMRGMTIELGFAWLPLDSGQSVSIVDVPGHERFVKHMIMGAGGFDVALLVVAADEGIQAQTREHLEILDLLEVRHGIVVVTKVDIADPELAELVELEVADELRGTSLEGSPAVQVSAVTGAGLDRLRAAISDTCASLTPRPDRGRPRLYVDRSFTIAGFGAVLTGTLDGGAFSTGDEVRLLPSGDRGRIRGVQMHRESVSTASPGSRVALNVSGVGRHEVPRGEAVTSSVGDAYAATRIFDAEVRAVRHAPRPLRHNHKVSVYGGTWEEAATVRLLGGDSLPAGAEGFAQIVMRGSRPLAAGDRFVIRDSNATLAGGSVLSVNAARHRRHDPAVLSALASLASGSGDAYLLQHLESAGLATAPELASRAAASASEVERFLSDSESAGDVLSLEGGGRGDLYATRGQWQRMRDSVVVALGRYHAAYPLRVGMPRQAVRSASGTASEHFDPVLAQLDADGLVVGDETTVRLATFEPTLSAEQEQSARRYVGALREGGYSPPSGLAVDGELLAALVSRGDVVLAGDVVFAAEKFGEMRDGVIAHCESNGDVSINDVREMFRTSRKFSLALLEQLDRDNVTMRVGDLRRLR